MRNYSVAFVFVLFIAFSYALAPNNSIPPALPISECNDPVVTSHTNRGQHSPCDFDYANTANVVDLDECYEPDQALYEKCISARATIPTLTNEWVAMKPIKWTDGSSLPLNNEDFNDFDYKTLSCWDLSKLQDNKINLRATFPFDVNPSTGVLDQVRQVEAVSLQTFNPDWPNAIINFKVSDNTNDIITGLPSDEMNAIQSIYRGIDFCNPKGASQLIQYEIELSSSVPTGVTEFCIAELITFTKDNFVVGQTCPCLNDGSFGSFCGRHVASDRTTWCYINEFKGDCVDPPRSSRSLKPYLSCTPVVDEEGNSCDNSIVIPWEGTLFGSLEKGGSDLSKAPEKCGHHVEGQKGQWFSILGNGYEVKLTTEHEHLQFFSSSISIYKPLGNEKCSNLTCVDFNIERKQNGPYSSAEVTLMAEKNIWYYIFVGADAAPYGVDLNKEGFYGKGTYALTVTGNFIGWNNQLNKSESLEYGSRMLDMYNGECRRGYTKTWVDNPLCPVTAVGCFPTIVVCIDIDECAMNDNDCHEFADCINTVGSYECKCKPSFSGDGVNECDRKDAWELLLLKRESQLANDIEREEYYMSEDFGDLEAKVGIAALKGQLQYLEGQLSQDYWGAKLKTEIAEIGARLYDTAVPPMPGMRNLDYLGRGYDMFEGNPATELGVDPGYRKRVVEFSYAVKLTGDAENALPDEVDAIKAPFSHFSSTAKMVTTAEELQSDAASDFSFGISAGLEFNPPGPTSIGIEGAFKMNNEMQESMSTVQNSESIYVQVQGRVTSYRARLEDETEDNLTGGFRAFVAELNPDCKYIIDSFDITGCLPADEQKYHELILRYGTHYTSDITFGGKAYQKYVMSINEVNQMQSQLTKNSKEWNAEVKGSYASVSGFIKTDGSMSDSMGTSMSNYLKESNVEHKQWFLGGTASLGDSEDGNLESMKRWAQTVDENPVPQKVSIQPISNMLTYKHFPTDRGILQKQSHLLAVLYNVCIRKGGDDCSQFLERVDSTGSLRYGDFVEIEPRRPEIEALVDYTREKYLVFQDVVDGVYPIDVTKVRKKSDGSWEFVNANNQVESVFVPVAINTGEICYCDYRDTSGYVSLTVHVDENSDVEPVVTVYNKDNISQRLSGYFYDLDDDDNFATQNFGTIPGAFGEITKVRFDVAGRPDSDDQLRIDIVHVNFMGVRYEFQGLKELSTDNGEGAPWAEWKAPTKEGSFTSPCNLLNSDGVVIDPNSAQSADQQCAVGCLSRAMPIISSGQSDVVDSDPQCQAWTYFEDPDDPYACKLYNRLSLRRSAGETISGFNADLYKNWYGKTEIKCVAPSNLPIYRQNMISAKTGKVGYKEFPRSTTLKFQLMSPFTLYNEARRTILYGDSIYISAVSGAITLNANDAIRILKPQQAFKLGADNNLVEPAAEDIQYISFRVLSDARRIGTPVFPRDPPVIFEIQSGFYTIIFNRLSVEMLTVAMPGDSDHVAMITNPSATPPSITKPTLTHFTYVNGKTPIDNHKFKLTLLDGDQQIPTRSELANSIITTVLETELLSISDTNGKTTIAMKLTFSPKPESASSVSGATFANSCINTDGNDFSFPCDSSFTLEQSSVILTGTFNERSNGIFRVNFRFNNVIDIAADPTPVLFIKFINLDNAPVDTPFTLFDPSPRVIGNYNSYRHIAGKPGTLTKSFYFKQAIYDGDVPLEQGTHYTVAPSGNNCNSQWDSQSDPTILSFTCSGVSEATLTDYGFTLVSPCSYKWKDDTTYCPPQISDCTENFNPYLDIKVNSNSPTNNPSSSIFTSTAKFSQRLRYMKNNGDLEDVDEDNFISTIQPTVTHPNSGTSLSFTSGASTADITFRLKDTATKDDDICNYFVFDVASQKATSICIGKNAEETRWDSNFFINRVPTISTTTLSGLTLNNDNSDISGNRIDFGTQLNTADPDGDSFFYKSSFFGNMLNSNTGILNFVYDSTNSAHTNALGQTLNYEIYVIDEASSYRTVTASILIEDTLTP